MCYPTAQHSRRLNHPQLCCSLDVPVGFLSSTAHVKVAETPFLLGVWRFPSFLLIATRFEMVLTRSLLPDGYKAAWLHNPVSVVIHLHDCSKFDKVSGVSKPASHWWPSILANVLVEMRNAWRSHLKRVCYLKRHYIPLEYKAKYILPHFCIAFFAAYLCTTWITIWI